MTVFSKCPVYYGEKLTGRSTQEFARIGMKGQIVEKINGTINVISLLYGLQILIVVVFACPTITTPKFVELVSLKLNFEMLDEEDGEGIREYYYCYYCCYYCYYAQVFYEFTEYDDQDGDD
ncbi:MAG: hypothetical protein EZS28_001315 [Streblomastix strix]|uniref:Uncharacterized protein n=1 Tax=Streblomastix strix TaxID=222440 RepID=A0A5J4X7F1_9EUKA|nr:MAG: hypothetical protein EZS28_001315 [Streblomastix strix]